MCHRVVSFACDVFVIFSAGVVPLVALWIHNSSLQFPCSFLAPWSMKIMPLHHRNASSSAPRFLVPEWISFFARHGRVQRPFQISPHNSKGFLVFFVVTINEVDTSHSSSIIDFWLLVCPFLFFFLLSGFFQFCSILQAIHDLVYHIYIYIPWDFLLSIEQTSWFLSTNLTKFCSNRHSSSHRFSFLAWRPDQCEQTLSRQCTSVE